MDRSSLREDSRPVAARESGRSGEGICGSGCVACGVNGEKVEAATCPNGLLEGDWVTGALVMLGGGCTAGADVTIGGTADFSSSGAAAGANADSDSFIDWSGGM